VTKAQWNESKLPLGVPSAKLNCPPYIFIPIKLKIIKNNISKRNKYPKFDKDFPIALTICAIDFKYLSNLTTLKTRKILKIRIALNAEIADVLPDKNEISIILKITTIVSK
jgi:hypothetical protein